MDYSKKTVWITGASSGIGEALTLAFAQRGARVVISSRKEATLEKVRNACPQPDRIFIYPLDVSDHAAAAKLARQVLEEVGPIDILINNAGISQRSLVKDTPLELDKKIMEVNFFGAVALTKGVLPSMLERSTGHIIVISSLTGIIESPLRSAYAASKHALHGFFDSLRSEVYDQGIRVLLVCPGFIKTNVSVNALTADGSKQNKMDDAQANGMEPAVLAEKIIRASEKGKQEAYFGGREVVSIYLKRFFPRLFSRIIRNTKVT